MADPKKKNTAAAVREIALPVAERLGLQLWDVQFVKEGPAWYLRILIDKPGGVNIEDCEAMSRAVDPLIDELDPTEHEYYLEVSSPGLGRALKSDEHLAAYIGRPVYIKLIRPDDAGIREYRGPLAGFTDSEITIQTEAGETALLRRAAAFIKADDDHWEEQPL